MPKTIGIVGSRRKNSEKYFKLVENKLLKIVEDGDYIVSGGCKQGADNFAEVLARKLGLTIIIHHANWEKYGKPAGFIRNSKIAQDADILIALVADDRIGGTEDTIKKYLKLGKKDLILLT